jgi:hypothetical protein
MKVFCTGIFQYFCHENDCPHHRIHHRRAEGCHAEMCSKIKQIVWCRKLNRKRNIESPRKRKISRFIKDQTWIVSQKKYIEVNDEL